METPFPFHRPARNPEMCGRDAGLARITRAVEANRPVSVTAGLAGLGLTSLALALRHRLSGSMTTVYVDLWPAEGPATLHRSAARSGGDPADNHAENGADGRSEGGEKADPGGWPQAVLAAATGDPSAGPTVALLDGAEWLASEEGRASAEALEEAVRRGDVLPVLLGRDDGGDGDSGGLSWLLEALTSASPGNPPSSRNADAPPSPGERLPLAPIPFRAWLPYVLERFLETERWIANEHVEEVVRFTGGHPRYTQHLLHLVWSACGPDGRVSGDALRQARRDLIAREDPAFRALWRTLSPNQRRVAWGLALESEPSPYSAEFLERWDLASPSSAQRALSSLQMAGVVDKEDGDYGLRDPLLPRWLSWRWGGGVVAMM